MDKLKYQILRQVHSSSPVSPVRIADLYADTARINQYRQAVKELTASGYLCQRTGSDSLALTASGVAALEVEASRRRSETLSVVSVVLTALTLIASLASLLLQAR